MSAAILCFTENGQRLGEKIAAHIPDCAVERPARGTLMAEAARLFREADALIFIGACGIAVRSIAPLVAHKASDPAVIVLDEKGNYVISLLSGHIGGANQLARQIAAITGGQAVITTATDVNGRFSADAWAAWNDCAIDSLETAKAFSAAILREDLPMLSDFPLSGPLPGGVRAGGEGDCGAVISVRTDLRPFAQTLRLIPRVLYVGIGCRRGTPSEEIKNAVGHALALARLDIRGVKAVASIDRKKNEPGLLACCGEWNVPIEFYTARELQEVTGTFAHSDYVLQTVGVGNVCERAAVRSAGEGAELIVGKTVLDGVTVAVAQRKWGVCFG